MPDPDPWPKKGDPEPPCEGLDDPTEEQEMAYAVWLIRNFDWDAEDRRLALAERQCRGQGSRPDRPPD